jgi:hypothetical protein
MRSFVLIGELQAPSLQTLSVGMGAAGPRGLAHLTHIGSRFPALRSLSFGFDPFLSDDGVRLLAQSPASYRLEYLDVMMCEHLSWRAVGALLTGCPRLRGLHLNPDLAAALPTRIAGAMRRRGINCT